MRERFDRGVGDLQRNTFIRRGWPDGNSYTAYQHIPIEEEYKKYVFNRQEKAYGLRRRIDGQQTGHVRHELHEDPAPRRYVQGLHEEPGTVYTTLSGEVRPNPAERSYWEWENMKNSPAYADNRPVGHERAYWQWENVQGVGYSARRVESRNSPVDRAYRAETPTMKGDGRTKRSPSIYSRKPSENVAKDVIHLNRQKLTRPPESKMTNYPVRAETPVVQKNDIVQKNTKPSNLPSLHIVESEVTRCAGLKLNAVGQHLQKTFGVSGSEIAKSLGYASFKDMVAGVPNITIKNDIVQKNTKPSNLPSLHKVESEVTHCAGLKLNAVGQHLQKTFGVSGSEIAKSLGFASLKDMVARVPDVTINEQNVVVVAGVPNITIKPVQSRSEQYNAMRQYLASKKFNVRFTGSAAEAESLCADLARSTDTSRWVIGFDMEWPSLGAMPKKVALVQLCSGSDVWLIQVGRMEGFPKNLKAVLESRDIIKCGVGIDGDTEKLRNDFRVSIKGRLQLEKVIPTMGIQTMSKGLKSMAAEFVGIPSSKKDIKVVAGNWNNPNLTANQLTCCYGCSARFGVGPFLIGTIRPESILIRLF